MMMMIIISIILIIISNNGINNDNSTNTTNNNDDDSNDTDNDNDHDDANTSNSYYRLAEATRDTERLGPRRGGRRRLLRRPPRYPPSNRPCRACVRHGKSTFVPQLSTSPRRLARPRLEKFSAERRESAALWRPPPVGWRGDSARTCRVTAVPIFYTYAHCRRDGAVTK